MRDDPGMSSTRRSFLGAAAAVTSSLALPAVSSPFRRAEGRRPRGKARLMVIGVAGRGGTYAPDWKRYVRFCRACEVNPIPPRQMGLKSR